MPTDEQTGETGFDKKFNKLLESFGRKKKKDGITKMNEEEVEELLESLKASGKAHLEDEANEFTDRLQKKYKL